MKAIIALGLTSKEKLVCLYVGDDMEKAIAACEAAGNADRIRSARILRDPTSFAWQWTYGPEHKAAVAGEKARAQAAADLAAKSAEQRAAEAAAREAEAAAKEAEAAAAEAARLQAVADAAAAQAAVKTGELARAQAAERVTTALVKGAEVVRDHPLPDDKVQAPLEGGSPANKAAAVDPAADNHFG